MLINALTGSNYSFKDVESYTNHAMFFITSVVLYSLYFCDYYYNCFYITLLYFSIELCFLPIEKIDMIVHHVLAMLMNIYYFSNIHINPNANLIAEQVMNVEWSNYFLYIEFLLKNKRGGIYDIIKPVNNILFIITFFKVRLYDIYYNIIFNKDYAAMIIQNSPTNFNYVMGYIAPHSFFLLNTYWFLIILKVVFKTIKKSIQFVNERNAEFILQYSYCLSLVCNLYANYELTGYMIHDIYDITTLGLVCFSSYLYHGRNYKMILQHGQNFNIATIDQLKYLLIDVLCINMRNIYVVYTHFQNYQLINGNYDYFSYYIILNLLSPLYVACYMSYFIFQKIYWAYNDNTTKTFFLYTLLSLSPLCCTLLSIIGVQNRNVLLHTLYNVYFIIMCVYMQTFYEFNHNALHLLLAFQNYIFVYCLINNEYTENKYKAITYI